MSQISVRPLPDGRLTVEASPGAASALSAMLRTFASLLDAHAS